MTVMSVDNAPHYLWGQSCDGWHLAKTKRLSVIQERVPRGCAEVMHYHQHTEQFFYILSGTASFELNGTKHQLVAHQGIHVPAGVAHQLRNQDQEDLIFLVISTPPSHTDKIEGLPPLPKKNPS